MKYYKIGEKFTHEGVELIVVDQCGCRGCALEGDCKSLLASCSTDHRKDKKSVIFKKVTDV